MKKILVFLLPLLIAGIIQAQAASNLRAVAGGSGGGGISTTLTSSHILIGNASNVATDTAMSGDATISNGGVLTLGTVNSNVGSFGSTSAIPQFTVDAKGRITAASNQNPIAAPIASLTGGGTGVVTALGVNIGSAGAPVLFNGAGGTPSSLTCTNCNGTAASLTAGTASAVAASGITGNTLASGVTASSLTSFGANPAIGAATATTPTTSDNNTNVATTAYVRSSTAGTRIKLSGFSTASATTGQQGSYATAPCAGTITGYDIVANAGTATIQTWKHAVGTAPTVSDSISTSGVQLSSGTDKHGVCPGDCGDFITTTVAQWDRFGFNISATSGATQLYFDIELTCTN